MESKKVKYDSSVLQAWREARCDGECLILQYVNCFFDSIIVKNILHNCNICNIMINYF